MAQEKASLFKLVSPPIDQFIRLLPDSIIMGSGFYALVTVSLPFAVLFGSMIEASLLLRLFQSVFNHIGLFSPSAQYIDQKSIGESLKCRSSSMPTLSSLFIFGKTPSNDKGIPSTPIFMITAASAYLFSSLSTKSRELQLLGPAYSSRYYTSAALLSVLVLLVSLFRLLQGCDRFGVIAISIILGLIVGTLLVYQNNALFQKRSTNLVGIPLLQNLTAEGKPIYVCG